jgi:hypothetical protein
LHFRVGRGKRLAAGLTAAVAVAASVLAGAGGTASASTAAVSASASVGGCNAGSVCLYDDPDFSTGPSLTRAEEEDITGELSVQDMLNFDDLAESIANMTSSRWCFFSGSDFSGETFEIHAEEDWSTLPGYIDSNIDSARPGPCPTIIGRITGLDGRCLDIRGGTAGNHVPVDLWSCNGGGGQEWQVNTNGFGTVSNGVYCLGTEGGGTANGTLADVYQCNNTNGQNWTSKGNGELVQQSSGKCLDDTNGSTSGAQLQIWSCAGNANQRYSVPSLQKRAASSLELPSAGGEQGPARVLFSPASKPTASRRACQCALTFSALWIRRGKGPRMLAKTSNRLFCGA